MALTTARREGYAGYLRCRPAERVEIASGEYAGNTSNRFRRRDRRCEEGDVGKRWILSLSASLFLATSACGNGGDLQPLPTTAPSAYHLGAGDELRITVFGLEAMNNTYRVDDAGAIALPMLDPIQVAGKTVREVETAIADKIHDRQLVLDPKVSAQIQTYRPFFIAGEVRVRGNFPMCPACR